VQPNPRSSRLKSKSAIKISRTASASSELVVIGRVTDVRRWTIPKSAASRYHTSEHSADWHEAVLQIDSVLKGTKPKKGKMVVRFPLSRDVAG